MSDIESAQDHGYWRAILDCLEPPIIVTTPAGIIREFNASAERLLGYRADDITGRMPLTMLHDPHELVTQARALSLELGVGVEPGFGTLIAAARATAIPASTWTYLRNDGTRLRRLLRMNAVRGTDGSLQGFILQLEALPRQAAPDPSAGELPGGDPSGSRDEERDAACFAPSEALRRMNGDTAVLLEVVELFLREHRDMREGIAGAVSDSDPKRLARAAHKLRGALLNLAANPAAQAALAIEECGKRACLPVPAQLEALTSELDRLSVALSSFVRASVPP